MTTKTLSMPEPPQCCSPQVPSWPLPRQLFSPRWGRGIERRVIFEMVGVGDREYGKEAEKDKREQCRTLLVDDEVV